MKRLFLGIGMIMATLTARSQVCDTNLFPNGIPYYDTYRYLSGDITQWAHYNTHDPTVNKQGEWYYMYSTDASYGGINKTAAQKKRSKDLVNWEHVGTAFDGIPQSATDYFLTHNSSYSDMGIWAPYLLKYKEKYILYYSAPGGPDGVNNAFIGYATSDSAGGPWTDQGKITTSWSNSDYINAIDPSVIYDSVNKKLWMVYGSWFTGIYRLELDTATGGIKTAGDRGTKVADRVSGGGLEGPELTYRNGWYYLFVSYDPLGDIYNVRVGRSRSVTGPYLDFNGKYMAQETDNIPMVLAPYRFNTHFGWQGTGHCGVFNDNGKYYMFHQGRVSVDGAMMVGHVREIFWVDDWPVVSPERYAGVPNCSINADSLVGYWEHLPLIYNNNASSNFYSKSQALELHSDGTFNDNTDYTWTLNADTLILNWGTVTYKTIVYWGWDWEFDRKTILYTGINNNGLCAWGKKIDKKLADSYPTTLTDGVTYKISCLHSKKLLRVSGESVNIGTRIVQASDQGLRSQLWKIRSTGDGYYYLFPNHAGDSLVMEVSGTGDGSIFRINSLKGTDVQKFKLIYNSNSYFRIVSKASSLKRGADVDNFSVAEGANILQWTYAGGTNQNWKFQLIDTVPIDTSELIIQGIHSYELSEVNLYPNPSIDGNITIDLSSLYGNKDINLSVINISGVTVFNENIDKPSVHQLNMDLPKGVYFVKIKADNKVGIKKLIIE